MPNAEIIIKQKSSKADKPYTYSIPLELEKFAQPGKRVLVPFGRYNKPEIGIILSVDEPSETEFRIKSIMEILDKSPLINEKMLELAYWMKTEYICSFSEAIQTVLPPGDYREVKTYLVLTGLRVEPEELTSQQKQIIKLAEDRPVSLDEIRQASSAVGIFKALQDLEDRGIIKFSFDVNLSGLGRSEKMVKPVLSFEEGASKIGANAKKQDALWKELSIKSEMTVKDILKDTNTSLSILRAMESKGLVNIYDRRIDEAPIGRIIKNYTKIDFNREQKEIFEKITESKGDKFLIHGITGSGKTEIYLQLVEYMLLLDKDSIILVPEIALTPQTIDRFAGRFDRKVAILHSGLTQSERFDQWKRIRSGEYKIVVGARSAIFAPFQNLGLIVIDEEHENTYKSSVSPKYNTVDVAKKRCELEGCSLVLGTATPSIETYFSAQSGDLKLLEMTKRATPMQLPEISIVDMREELNQGNRSILSRALYSEMKMTLEAKKQIIIFLNRRGYSGSVVCRSCGYVAKCKSCEVSMTHHKQRNRLVCHYCGSTSQLPSVCPICGSNYIRGFGAGTEKVEEAITKLFPKASIGRMDSDIIKNKTDYEDILHSFKTGELDILIGTQMISKGLDFPNVTLVGILAADITLNLPDFRSPERSFQLITQVAGRAGRGEVDGKVILQTYNPEHYSIKFANDKNYIGFYEEEIKLRKAFRYPPFINMAVVTIFGSKEHDVVIASDLGRKLLSDILENYKDIEVIGPHPAPLERLNNKYRYQIVLKFSYNIQNEVKEALKRVFSLDEGRIKKNDIKVSIDIDPISIL